MSGFSSKWLELREPIDHAARSEAIVSALCHVFLNHNNIRITDIGTGTGSTVRALKPFLGNATWCLVDNDRALLEEAGRHVDSQHTTLIEADLSEDLSSITASQPDLVTTSAFLDLVSRSWLEQLVDVLSSENLPFYAALTYDGRSFTTPENPAEKPVIEAFNNHQRTDKGFGPALGPDAAETAIQLFEDAGYVVMAENSDWQASSRHREFQKMLLEGWAKAACEIQPENSPQSETWLRERIERIGSGELHACVGHKDFLALPAQG